MAKADDWHVERIPYGKQEVEIRIPTRNYLATLAPRYRPGLEDTPAAIRHALAHPIGSRRLRDIARGKQSAVIVVNDVTRPTASDKLLPPLLEELREAGLGNEQILFLVATGTHRDNTREELERMLGKRILDEFRVLNHHCQDEENMLDLGKTREGIPVVINRLFCEAAVKILTGTIGPHHGAGFSGGRKSLLPGLASLSTLKRHHGFHMRAPKPAMGWVEGNRFHEAALEAARMAGVDFILNTVQNDRKEISHVVAGDLEQAWLDGVRASREIFEVRVPEPAEIVITSPGGYPKDINLWQSQKAMSAAELVVKDGGTVILSAECPDGVGSRGFYEWMSTATCPQDVIDRFIREEYSVGSSKAWMYSRCLKRAELVVVTQGIDDQTLQHMFTKRADTVEKAIAIALARHGENARIILLRNGSDLIPGFEL
ncbi:MAG TPA: nickel-dependent lactate racemase [Candidatus Methylomirabilis sp.]|nr:nickel-dependent lactate racemase [Candidatus Methylomirabilis sp.]